MKTIRGLNIKDWSAHIFTSMTNIDEIDPDFFFWLMILKVVKMDQ